MALESLGRVHDDGVLLGSVQLDHILVQRTQVPCGCSVDPILTRQCHVHHCAMWDLPA